jgi:hypothetical protein
MSNKTYLETFLAIPEKDLVASIPFNQEGTIFPNGIEKDLRDYVLICFGSFLFFWMVFFFWDFFFSKVMRADHYNAKDNVKKTEYLGLYAANTHHAIICTVCIYFMYSSSVCDGGLSFEWLRRDECFLQVDKNHVIASVISVGFLGFDFCVNEFLIGGNDALHM